MPVPLGLPAPPAPPAAPLEPGDFLGVLFGLVLLEPELGLPPAPDEPELAPLEELPGEELAPPDADLLASRSQPAISAPLSANATAATNAVNFILTSMGLCAPYGSK